MKKYKVITDNLDWYNLPKGTIIQERGTIIDCNGKDESYWDIINNGEEKFIELDLHLIIEKHPNWFEEIKEKKWKAHIVHIIFSPNRENPDHILINDVMYSVDYINKELIDAVSTSNWAEEFLKEETKPFAKDDMIEFGNYCSTYAGAYEGGLSLAHNAFYEWLKSKEND